MLSSPSQRVPMRVFPLINGCCQGARRVINSARPHTFQLIVEGKSLLLAAPNEYVASEWLQELVHAASGVGYLYFAIYFVCNGLIRNYHSFWVDYIFFVLFFRCIIPTRKKIKLSLVPCSWRANTYWQSEKHSRIFWITYWLRVISMNLSKKRKPCRVPQL